MTPSRRSGAPVDATTGGAIGGVHDASRTGIRDAPSGKIAKIARAFEDEGFTETRSPHSL